MDLIEATRMHEQLYGVTTTQNRCGDGMIAYDITENAMLMVHTNTLFPSGIPQDFSILVVAKPKASESKLVENCIIKTHFYINISVLIKAFLIISLLLIII